MLSKSLCVRSFHPERKWKRTGWVPGSKSIFNTDWQEDEYADGQGAGEGAAEEDEVGDCGAAAQTRTISGTSSKASSIGQKTFYITK